MHDADLILTVATGLGAALILGYVTHRLGLSPIVGYLIAGVAVGPHTPGVVANVQFAEQLANLGIVLLMFGVGLQFHLEDLLAVRRLVVPGALAGITAAATLGLLAARMGGWPWTSALVFGLTLSVASTVVLVRILADRGVLHTSTGHIAVGWLVVEDLFTIIVLVLLPTLVSGRPTVGGIAAGIAATALKIGALMLAAAFLAPRIVPRLMDRVAATRSRELFTLTVLVLALGIAVGAAMLFDVSMPLGAFVAGMVVGRSEYSLRAATEALPMRDAFAVLFFVSVGMLLDPRRLLDAPGLALAALGIVVVAKPLVAALVIALARYPLHTVLTVPVALAQIGEFSFILAAMGRELRLLPDVALNIVVAVSIVSIVMNPLASRAIGPIERWLIRRKMARRHSAPESPVIDAGAQSSIEPEDRAIVVGYGPTGRNVARLLRDNGIAPTVIELNTDTVRALREQGTSAIYGDAYDPETLVKAGVRHARTLVVSGALENTPEIIRSARELNPSVHALARAAYLRDVPVLRRAGAEQVFAGEGEVALAMTEAVLRRLGATPDQIDREHARVRAELYGGMSGRG